MNFLPENDLWWTSLMNKLELPNHFVLYFTKNTNRIISIRHLLSIVDKYVIPINQWTLLCQSLLEVSMNKLALWINVCADDWTAEMSTIAVNAMFVHVDSLKLTGVKYFQVWLIDGGFNLGGRSHTRASLSLQFRLISGSFVKHSVK